MNYYELKDFESVQINELLLAFKNGETIIRGCISVFEDSIVRPGDRFVELKNIVEENDIVIFEFGNNEKVIVKNPSHIGINEKVIGIHNCNRIDWITNDLSLIFLKEKDLIKFEVIEGEHFFRVRQNSSALLFYTW